MKKLMTIFTILTVVLISGCRKDKFKEIAGLCPIVVSTSPEKGATNVPLDKIVTATFNESINPITITQSSFTLLQGTTKIAGTLTYDDATLTLSFDPTNPLVANTTYVGRISTAVKDLAGNALQEDYAWSFSTGAILSPAVITTDPASNASGVVLNKVVVANFNMAMDPSTITSSTFTLKQGTTVITGTVSYTGTSASFTPSTNLLFNTVYTATVSTGAKNLAAIGLVSDYTWTFTTGSVAAPTVILTDPADLATNVLLNKTVTATFSEAMDPLTITTSTFTLKQGAVVIAGNVTYSGTMASFNPSADLLSNTVYTATITTLAKNVAGVGIANNYVWTFTTGIVVAPTVTSTDPINNATNVALNKVITATFSVPMDPLTITTATFLIKTGATSVAGIVSYAGTIASFTPSSNLLSNTTYVATITTGAQNVAGVALANNYVWSFTTLPSVGPGPIILNTADRFGIFAAMGITNVGASVITNLDVGISPGFRSSITGFFVVDGGPGTMVGGDFYAADDAAPTPAMLIQSKSDLQAAYDAAAAASAPAPATVSGDLGGQTLAPGIYKSTSSLNIASGNLTLDAQGDVNAVWIFQIATSFTSIGGSPFPSGSGGNVILAGGANADNVFWQVGSSATIGDYTSFKGNVMALTSITMNTGSELVGRTLVLNGAVSLSGTNKITRP